jgi:predicted outer membrane protein
MKRLFSCLIVIIPVLAWGVDKSPDQDFFKHAAEGGIAEVEAGKLAQSKGNSQAVKDFGAMMVKDHTDANAKLESMGARFRRDDCEPTPSQLINKRLCLPDKAVVDTGSRDRQVYPRVPSE